MSAADQATQTLRKDQRRALQAYAWAETAKRNGAPAFEDYRTGVQAFAAALLLNGLAAAVSALERRTKETDAPGPKRTGSQQLIADLASWSASDAAAWPTKVRRLDLNAYMLETRELIAVLAWLQRACRALEE